MSKIKNILVCGASGFMGRNIANNFIKSEKYKVYGVSKLRIPENFNEYEKYFNCDLTTQEGINHVFDNEIKFDIVIQAAATTSGAKDIVERPHLHVTDNAVMNSLILRACYDYNVEHFLFLSCGVMYNPDRSPNKECSYHIEEEIYKNYFGVGWTKVYTEKMCEFFSRLGKTKHTVLRQSNVYGPHDKYDLEKSHVFGATITKVMEADDGESIVVWGDGTGTERDLLYVEDAVNMIELVIEKQKKPYDLFNVSYGKSFSVKTIVEKIIKLSKKNVKIEYDLTKPTIKTKLVLDSQKAEIELGWKPKHSFEEGIIKTLDWYKLNKS